MPTYQGHLSDLESVKGRLSLSGLTIPALARLLSQALDGLLVDQTLFVLTPTPVEAEDLALDLRFFRPQTPVVILPPADTKPFLNRALISYVAAERLRALYHLVDSSPAVVVASMAAASRLVPPPELVGARVRLLATGQETNYEDLGSFLASSGYVSVGQVESVGDYSLRGGLLDIYPPGLTRPIRAEFFGDFVESVRTFRVDDQKSVDKVNQVWLLPASEVSLTRANGEKAASALANLASQSGWLKLLWEPIAERFKNSLVFDDLENWAPLFQGAGTSLNSYLTKARVILFEPENLVAKGQEIVTSLAWHFQRLVDEGRPHLPVDQLFEEPEEFLRGLSPRVIWETRDLFLSELTNEEDARQNQLHWSLPYETNSDLKALMSAPRRATGLLGPLVARIKALLGRGFKVNLVLRSQDQSRRLAELLATDDLAPTLSLKGQAREGELKLVVGQLSAGFVAPFDREAFIAEDEIFGITRAHKRRSGDESRILKGFASLRDLNPYDYVVHNEHGIGHYLGLVSMVTDSGHQGDFLHLAYHGGDSLFVPVERFGAVTKYIGSQDHPPKVDHLGGGNWEKVKAKVKENIRERAEELLRLYAQRQLAEGFAFSPRDTLTREFENSFEFVETPDQEKAIEEVISDLTADRPMDRLVCGDVGFGKTEVAARAAFKVVMDHRQVAILVPTTILAEQHERTFVERLKDWPINVASLSRFKKPSEQKEIVEKLADGRLDILVGTHRILRPDVKFKDLGLLIIDEEHRFGVGDKEKLKQLRVGVDVLSMSATPIPRSLSMSMSGIRDMSIIETPPQDRLPVETVLIRRDDESIREAIDRELARQGQVFFIHNRVKDIAIWIKRLQNLLPLARFGVGHGQMKAEELEKVTRAFFNHEIDVWIATSIVESGLDFPSANTIIIDQADHFGLAQLYQLRGRVGRGVVQAYAYLMVDNPDTLTMDAKKRLKALLDHSELGSGYQIALHDLRIRGSGNILGSAQSGQAQLVGYEMYAQLLEQVMRELKNEDPQEDFEPEVVVGLPAYLPANYTPDTEARLNIYRRLSQAREEKEVEEMALELKDRFGAIPVETLNLLDIMSVKAMLRKSRIRRLESGEEGLTITFGPEGPLDLNKILNLAQNSPGCRLSPSGRLFVSRKFYAIQGRPLEGIKAFLVKLA
ncbi:MAG: transcription-repair coupling factor [Deltaproteobacteria bacterium]|jgi:transcription-repair coupling factor (superfamily II helicase)|nr:transcription-repair coupling factor [Deltaproteobacteria bacterium]